MKLTFRIIMFLGSALLLLAASAVAAMQLTGSVWIALAAVSATALILGNIVDEVLGIGTYLGERRAKAAAAAEAEDEDDAPPGLKEAISNMLKRHGLKPVSMHRVGGDGPDDDDDDEDELHALLKQHAAGVIDGDLKEAFFHMSHIMSHCPNSLAHAKRLQVVTDLLDVRLKASTVAALNDSDRPTMH